MMIHRERLLCLLVAIVLGGCTAEQKVVCGPGTELVAGECVRLSSDAALPDSDAGKQLVCGDDTLEVDGGCIGLRPIGAPCTRGAECSSGTCLSEDLGAVGGYCTITPCSENRPCPAGSRCTFSSTEESFLCLATCDDVADCRPQYACQPLYTSEASICAPSCANTGACPSGTRCDQSSGTCVLHECELGSSAACGNDEDAGTAGELICYADRLGLSKSGGLCLPACDPQEPGDACASNEVCQPLPEEPVHSGLCVPPLCARTEDCSAGAVCMAGICQPPARCDKDAECPDEDSVCVGGAGGQCMPKCPKGAKCSDLHSGLVCALTLDACLPVGSFPGGACRNDALSPCSDLRVRGDQVDAITPMVCEDGLCLATCAGGGETLCDAISPALSCANGVFDEPVCLPRGSFPGSPCRTAVGDECDDNLRGLPDADLTCVADVCAVQCETLTIFASGDGLCGTVSSALTFVESPAPDVCVSKCVTSDACSTGYSCLVSQDACLPTGSFLGSPCAGGSACAAGATPALACVPAATPLCGAACDPLNMGTEYCQALNGTLGTTFDTCGDADPGAGEVFVCVDIP